MTAITEFIKISKNKLVMMVVHIVHIIIAMGNKLNYGDILNATFIEISLDNTL